MISIRRSEDRGSFDHGWLKAKHTFSFARYVDRRFMGFRDLRVINEDIVAPGRGFGEHPHDNMEILTYIISGTLAHRDSLGNVEFLRPGEVQRMSAGRGIEHAEFNPSSDEPVHLLQIWILPKEQDTEASYEQKTFSDQMRRNALVLIASPEAVNGAVRIGQDVRLYTTVMDAGASQRLALAPGRHAWVQVVRGSIDVGGHHLKAGDGAGVSDEAMLELRAASTEGELSEAPVFDLA